MYHCLSATLNSNGNNSIILSPGGLFQKSWLKRYTYNDVEYVNFRCPKPKNKGRILRFFSELALSPLLYLSLLFSRNKLEFTHSIVQSPTIFYSLICVFFRVREIKIILVQRDFFPKWAVDQGILSENSLITKFLSIVSVLNFKVADHIALQSPQNYDFFISEYATYANKAFVLYNWTEPHLFNLNGPQKNQILERLGIRDKVVYFYGGNMGLAQNMGAIVRLAEKFDIAGYKSAHFLLVGDGDKFNDLSKYLENSMLTNISLFKSIDQETYHDLLSEVDVGLISLSQAHTTSNYPGKMLGYMEAGMPILGTVNSGNDLKQFLQHHNAGLISNDDEARLFSDAVYLLENVNARVLMGKRSRELIASHFSVQSAAKTISELL